MFRVKTGPRFSTLAAYPGPSGPGRNIPESEVSRLYRLSFSRHSFGTQGFAFIAQTMCLQ